MERQARHTRCHAAPDWTSGECLSLVNEINAVEGEWRNSLSSFQKWQLVVENCSSLGIHRSLNQCKRKWDALRSGYEKIKMREGTYWSFDANKRKDMGLPEEFDEELFRAIKLFSVQKGEEVAAPETDPDSDPEAQARTKRYFLQTGPKKQRKKRIPCKSNIAERFHPWRHILGGIIKPEPSSSKQGPEGSLSVGVGKITNQTVKPELSTTNENLEHEATCTLQNVKLLDDTRKELEKVMTAKLLENAQRINAALRESHAEEEADCKLADLRKTEVVETDFIRLQGDKIIGCLGNIMNTINQFCNAVLEHNVQPQTRI